MWTRVVAGVDGSLASLSALRLAVAIARRDALPLHVVWVWGREVVGHTNAATSAAHGPHLIREGRRRVADAFERSLGDRPTDVKVAVHVHAYEGNPGAVLTYIAYREQDLLVIGAGATRWWHPRKHAVSSYCVKHACCPIVVAPLSEFAQTVSSHPGEAKRLARRLLRSVATSDPGRR